MRDLNVQHYLRIYRARLKMQEDGITNPSQEIKEITRMIVEKLSNLQLDEIIILNDGVMKDSKGNIIVEFPAEK